jgi:hypothetical protein
MTASAPSPGSTPLAAFQITLTCVSVFVTLSIFWGWLGLRQAQSDLQLTPLPGLSHSVVSSGSPSASWTSPRLVSFLVLLVAVTLVQIVLLWSRGALRRWWFPIVIEAALAMAFAVTAHQVIGTISTTCHAAGSGPERCLTTVPPLYPGGWCVVLALIGLGLGTVWSLCGRSGRRHRHSLPPPPTGAPATGIGTTADGPRLAG